MTRPQNSLFLADKSSSPEVKKKKEESTYKKRNYKAEYNSHPKTETVKEPEDILSESTDSVFQSEQKNVKSQFDQKLASGDQSSATSNGKKASPYATVELYQVPKLDNEDTEELPSTEPHYMVRGNLL